MADPSERYNDPQHAMRTAVDGYAASMWTALPAIVTAYDPARLTVSAQPAIKARQTDLASDETKHVAMPLCVDVPVVFPHGGGFAVTLPIAVGDEVLLVFASRCIDGWWQEGGTQPQLDARKHDLSDAFAIPGPWSQKTKLGGVSATAAELRSLDGATKVSLTAGKVTITAPAIELNSADVQINGASLKHNGHDVGSTHKHTGVTSGGGVTGVPV